MSLEVGRTFSGVVRVPELALGAQDVLVRMKDSVVGALKPDFLEKTSDSADLCAACPHPEPTASLSSA